MLGLLASAWLIAQADMVDPVIRRQQPEHVVAVTLIGEESARIVSSDPETREAKQAEARGQSVACGGNSGALNIIAYKGQFYLIGAAHAYYKIGHLKCDDGFGSFYPDDHYYPGSSEHGATGRNIEFNRAITFSLPPLNGEFADKGSQNIAYSDARNLNDFVILDIIDDDFLDRQTGGYRWFMVLSDSPADDLVALSYRENVQLISSRKNFHKKYEVGIEDNCQIHLSKRSGLLRHGCDTGQGSSGSALTYVSDTGQLIAIGFHYASLGSPSKLRPPPDPDGNYFISSEHILSVLSKLDLD